MAKSAGRMVQFDLAAQTFPEVQYAHCNNDYMGQQRKVRTKGSPKSHSLDIVARFPQFIQGRSGNEADLSKVQAETSAPPGSDIPRYAADLVVVTTSNE